ncbi:MAG: hypothetical protein JW751_15390 [Polyangiaceae bacterium]|nr:hypothetical protein [Polyangiaceae bacterium]
MSDDLTTFEESRALAQRAANERAKAAGEPLPFPNVWDVLDPTKTAADATPDEIARSQAEFSRLCRRPPCRRYEP